MVARDVCYGARWRIMDKLSKGEITPRLFVNREDSVTAKGSPENAVANV